MGDLRHRHADVGDGIRMHYVEAGEGPLVVLLHGFPEFWFGWRNQIDGLAARGFRVIAPDLRGYNLTHGPREVAEYGIEKLAADVAGLIRAVKGGPARLAGHDWGAAVAWATAMHHPQRVARLAVLNVPHPRRMQEGLRTPRQLAKSWYIFAFQLPRLPERLVRAGNWAFLRRQFEDARPGAFPPEDVARYVEAWERPGAMTAMVNYYRAAVRDAPRAARRVVPPVKAPTRVIWGDDDRYLSAELAEPHRADVPNLERVIHLPGASHWVQHDEPEQVTELLAEFFA
ncbi:MAG TPA: alpha/beta hydrolase [Solirubrobacteraceae bacterium]|jgi:pimeloyl-ACP methyl ester carboxylesterase